jgi:uncharacterized protein (DUF4415 family)
MKTKKTKMGKVPEALTDEDVNSKNIKIRVNMFMDLDVVEHFRKLSKNKGLGYQTLINQALREYISGLRGLERRVEELEKKLTG